MSGETEKRRKLITISQVPPNLWNKDHAPTPVALYPHYRECILFPPIFSFFSLVLVLFRFCLYSFFKKIVKFRSLLDEFSYIIVQLPRLRVLDKIVIGPSERERARAVVRDKFELKADDPYPLFHLPRSSISSYPLPFLLLNITRYKFMFAKTAFPQRRHKPLPTNSTKPRTIHFKETTTTTTSTSTSHHPPHSHHPHTHTHSHEPHHPHSQPHHSLTRTHSHNENHDPHLYTSNDWEESENNTNNCNDSSATKNVHYNNNNNSNNNLNHVNINTFNNYNSNNNVDTSVTNKLSKLLLGREMGPLKGPVFKRGVLSEKVSSILNLFSFFFMFYSFCCYCLLCLVCWL